jgi:hypothetical protein
VAAAITFFDQIIVLRMRDRIPERLNSNEIQVETSKEKP